MPAMTAFQPAAERSTAAAIKRGLRLRCPACGGAPAFRGYLKVVERCARCAEPLGQIRADDFPPYITILLVGHIVVPLLLMAEQAWAWPLWIQMAVWPGVTLLLTLLLLKPIKGGVLGLMWSLKLRGDERH